MDKIDLNLFTEKEIKEFFTFDEKQQQINKRKANKEHYTFKSKNNKFENNDYYRYCNSCGLKSNKPLI